MSEKKEDAGAKGNGKFILLYVNEEDSKEMLSHILDESSQNERGVFLKSDLSKKIVEQFNYLADRGYFPTAMILSQENDLVEFTFRRHPEQQPSSKLTEFVGEDKFKL
jgi:hypothetical protein